MALLRVKKKKPKGKGLLLGKKHPFQLNSNIRNHFVIKPLSNFDLMDWIKRLGIKHLRGIYSRDRLPKKIRKECGIINLDDIQGPGTHWVCYRNIGKVVEYFDPFGLIMPNEALEWMKYKIAILFFAVTGVYIICLSDNVVSVF